MLMSFCCLSFCFVVAEVSSAGYKYLASRMKNQENPDNEQSAQDAFLLQLDSMENQLGRHSGPYMIG